MKTDIIIALSVLILAMLAFTATQGGNENPAPYCDMRALWIDSGGEHGWPEYEAGKDEAMNCELEGRS